MFDEKYDRGLKDFGPLITRMMARGAELLERGGNAPGEARLTVRSSGSSSTSGDR